MTGRGSERRSCICGAESVAASLAPEYVVRTPRSKPARRVLADILAKQFSHQEITMPPTFISPYLLPILLLLGSNIFMTLAWYGHLRFKESPLLAAILVSWGIALVEYCLA